MPGFYLGLYRNHEPFRADVVTRALAALERRLPGFFPAALPVAPDRGVPLHRPADYDAGLLPDAFTIEPGVAVQIPILGGDGTALDVIDDRAPDVTPASVVITFADPLPAIDRLEDLAAELVEALEPDQAWLTDPHTPIEPGVHARAMSVDPAKVPPALFWMTWLGPALLAAAGPSAQAALEAVVAARRAVAGGLLIRVQDEPPSDREAWAERRRAAEAALGLPTLQDRFPFD